MMTTRSRSLAVAIAGSLLATTQCFAFCGYKPGSPLPRHQTQIPVPTYTDIAVPTPVAPMPDSVPTAVPTYSASSSTTGPVGNAVGNGTMSAAVGAGGAMVATSARAGTDRASYCRRGGRSQAVVDACLKLAGGR